LFSERGSSLIFKIFKEVRRTLIGVSRTWMFPSVGVFEI